REIRDPYRDHDGRVEERERQHPSKAPLDAVGNRGTSGDQCGVEWRLGGFTHLAQCGEPTTKSPLGIASGHSQSTDWTSTRQADERRAESPLRFRATTHTHQAIASLERSAGAATQQALAVRAHLEVSERWDA